MKQETTTLIQEVNRNALKAFLKKMKFTLTIDEALASESCMTVFNAYCANVVQDQKSTKSISSLVTKKEQRPSTFLSKTGNRSSATQNDSYQAIKLDLGERQLLVLQFVKENPGRSRAELTFMINNSGTIFGDINVEDIFGSVFGNMG